MGDVLDFPTEVEYQVLFNLPKGKVIHINKESQDDFDVHLNGYHGSAVVPAKGKTGAINRIQKVFPTCEIVEVELI